jgi:hypothetical protein
VNFIASASLLSGLSLGYRQGPVARMISPGVSKKRVKRKGGAIPPRPAPQCGKAGDAHANHVEITCRHHVSPGLFRVILSGNLWMIPPDCSQTENSARKQRLIRY